MAEYKINIIKMKKLIYFLLFILTVHCTVNIETSMSQWVQTSSTIGTDGNILSYATTGSYIFTGVLTYGIYYTTNNGANWTSTPLNNRTVNALTVSSGIIFAGTDLYGIYISTNLGTNWTQTSLNNLNILSLNKIGTTLFAGASSYGVYISTNNGTNWTQSSLNNQTVRALVVSGTSIYAGTNGNGVFLSTNYGVNWTQTSLNSVMVFSMATLGSNVFAGMGSGVYLSTNNGAYWTLQNINGFGVRSLFSYENNLFAGTYGGGVYFSSNNGTNWIAKNQGFTTLPAVSCLLAANNYVFAGTFGVSIWRRIYSEIIGIQNISSEIPAEYSLYQNYPNPFNPTTKIRFDVAKETQDIASLRVYDILGLEAATLVNEKLSPGTYEVEWDASNFASGIYFYQLKTENFSATKKLILLK
jgi:hypothetical protein